MDKTRLAICIGDAEYEARFVKCVMNHYRESYEIHVVDDICEIVEEPKREFHVVITGDGNTREKHTEETYILFVLQENGAAVGKDSDENVFFTEKYQEVYKIMEEVEKAVFQRLSRKHVLAGKKEAQLIGVFSLEKEAMQIPFTALLAEILGEQNRVLVIDMQPFSGFSASLDSEEDALGMEDLMTVATTESYTSNRLVASIGQEQKWDFVYPVKNVQCLAEADEGLYQKMIQILQKERGYEQIILNFGAVFSGMMELMTRCQQLYFLTERKEEKNWREEAFEDEMRRRGNEAFLQRIFWIEIPLHFVKEKTWRQLTTNWLWNELGDKLREINWMESEHGPNM